MEKKTYGIALIGCGAMGEAHLEDIYCKEKIKIEFVCDLNIERAIEFQKKIWRRKSSIGL